MPRDRNPLASTTLITWMLSGVILIIAAYFVFYGAGIETESLSHFGSFFGGVATGFGVLFAGFGFYLQQKAQLNSASESSKERNFLTIKSLIEICNSFENYKPKAANVARSIRNRINYDQDKPIFDSFALELIKANELVHEIDEMTDNVPLENHRKVNLIRLRNKKIAEILDNTDPLISLFLSENGFLNRPEEIESSPILVEHCIKNREYYERQGL